MTEGKKWPRASPRVIPSVDVARRVSGFPSTPADVADITDVVVILIT